MADAITFREWRDNYNAGLYDGGDFETQVAAGWYDWFCRDSALASRLKKFGRLANRVTNDFLLDNYAVRFKNNCPGVGPLYDDMRFEPLDESQRDALYLGVTVDDERDEHKWNVFTARSDYSYEAECDDVRQVAAFLNAWPDC